MFSALYHFFLKMGATQSQAAAASGARYAAVTTRNDLVVTITTRKDLGASVTVRKDLTPTVTVH